MTITIRDGICRELQIARSGSTIHNVRKRIFEVLTSEIPDLRIGVIVFGWSRYDEYPTENTYNYIELTDDFDSIQTLINSLTAEGGTEPWGDALYLANTWNWREDASKLVILVGDEDCDPGIYVGTELLESDPRGYYNGSALLNIVTELKNKGAIISTVICEGASQATVGQFQWIAAYTDGTSVYLPDMEIEGINLPEIIEEWTLELGREYSKFLNLTVFWKDSSGVSYYNSQVESFWLDFTPPSAIISKTITPIGLGLFSVEFFIDVDDVSPIDSVTLFYNAYGSWESEILAPIENTSYYLFNLQDVTGGVNLSYFVKSSDILKNSAFTSVFWVIVEPKFDELGEEVSFWVEENKTIYTNIKIPSTASYYFILSGPKELDNITTQLTVLATNATIPPTQTSEVNLSSPNGRKIFQFNLGPGDHAVTLSIPSDLENFTASYVWVNMKQPVNNKFIGSMTDLIRVYGFEWEAINETYFSFDNQLGSPLVLIAEVYTSNWELVSTFNVGGSLKITYNETYKVLVWATKHIGEFTLQLTEETPTTFYDPYYTTTATAEWTRSQAGSASFPDSLLSLFVLSILAIFFRKRYRK
ncbi:hypothetical protein CEE45_09495 [Candidatus Heimdallarchaeota archaeon B3_Heim]|nr:MAG: hypothetical protein CEE45_09495 [Candidatus Heimdallarchaeota archaeon B3_Heim]